MKQELITAPVVLPPGDLLGMDTARLMAELTKTLSDTAERIVRLAWIVRILEDRGEDLSGLRIGMLQHLRRVAYGQVLPELVVRFASSPLVLQRVSLLPAPDQRRLADGCMIELVVKRGEAGSPSFDKRLADPARMTRDQLWQVFGPDRIRSEAEQLLYLEDRAAKPATSVPPRGKIRPDKGRGGFTVNRSFVSQVEVLEALASLREEEPAGGVPAEPQASKSEGDGEAKLVVLLTEVEHRRIKVRAAQNDTSMNDLARAALRAAGLI